MFDKQIKRIIIFFIHVLKDDKYCFKDLKKIILQLGLFMYPIDKKELGNIEAEMNQKGRSDRKLIYPPGTYGILG